MRIDTLHEKGTGTLNEDFCLVCDNLYGVFDGATSLTEQVFENGYTGGFLAANIAAKAFRQNNDTLYNLTQRANAAIADGMRERGVNVINRSQLWSTSAAVVRLQDDFFEWIQVGDCIIMVVYQDGTHAVLTENFDHDLETLRLWQETHHRTDDTILSALKDQIVKVRCRMNISYGALNGEKELVSFINSGTLGYHGLKHILMFTDGLFIPKEDPEKRENFNFFAKLYQERGLGGLRDAVRDIEKSDVGCRKYPRFKPHDDIAAISLTF